MPEFGNFQTILLLSGDDAHAAYLAHGRDGPEGHKYTLQVFRVRKATEDFERELEAIRNLGQDLQLAFIGAIKAQKRASDTGSRYVAPIYEVGVNSEGAWYATDYFPRGSLHDWIVQGRMPDERTLRSVIACVVAGLRDLKQHSGRSHGDLKTGNVLLPGKSGRSIHAGVQITEPLAGTEADAEQFERADLRAVGALLYQMVCLAEVQHPDQISHPLNLSHEWRRLGERGEYWLTLCNKLLANAPEISLESLAQELTPPKPTPKWKIYAMAAVLALSLLSGFLHFAPWWALPTSSLKQLASGFGNGRAREYLQVQAEYQTALKEAREQADLGEFTNARGWVTNALALKSRREAERLLSTIIEREAKFNQCTATIPQLLATMRYAATEKACAEARRFAPKSWQLDQWQWKAARLGEATQEFKEAHYAVAARKFEEILQANPQDEAIKAWVDRSTRCQDNWDLFDRTKRPDVLQLVLQDNPTDGRALRELNRVHAGEAAYRNILEKGQEQFDNGDYDAAAKQFARAIVVRNEPQSKNRLDASRFLKQLREQADRLYTERQWPAAEATFNEMLRYNPKDAYAAARAQDCRAQSGQ